MARFLGKQVSYPYNPILTILHPKCHSGWAQGTSQTRLFPEADCPLSAGWRQAGAGGTAPSPRGRARGRLPQHPAGCPGQACSPGKAMPQGSEKHTFLSLSWALPGWEPEGPDIGLNSSHFCPLPGNSPSPRPNTFLLPEAWRPTDGEYQGSHKNFSRFIANFLASFHREFCHPEVSTQSERPRRCPGHAVLKALSVVLSWGLV